MTATPKAPSIDDQIATAEAHAASISDHLAATEANIIAGDPKKSLSDIEDLERQARAAALNIRALRARRDEELEATRQAAIAQLRKEIAIHSADDLVGLLRDVETVATAFNTAVSERNTQIYEWRNRLINLGVETRTHATDDGSVAPSESIPFGIYLDGKFLSPSDPDQYLQEVILRAKEVRPRDIYAELKSNVGE